MIVAALTILTALSISTIAAFFSVVGLMTIFSATAIKVAIMGAVIEVGKIVSVVWLHQNWSRGYPTIKYCLIVAVAVIMLITSMGVFGLLSKGHIESQANLEQSTSSTSQIENRISHTREQISRQEKIVAQLDAAVDKYIENNYITRGLEKREDQQDIRDRVNAEIQNLNEQLASLQQEKYAEQSDVRALEREIGPVTYVAQLIYGNAAQDNIESSVRILIVILVIVFDPLAIMLLVAGQISISQSRKPKVDNDRFDKDNTPVSEKKRQINRKKSRMGQQTEQM